VQQHLDPHVAERAAYEPHDALVVLEELVVVFDDPLAAVRSIESLVVGQRVAVELMPYSFCSPMKMSWRAAVASEFCRK
jgi:hypothetical protein